MTVTLIYHDIAAAADREQNGFPGPLAARYKLDPARFAEHLDAIAATGVEVGLLDGEGRGPQAALTFDDGGASAPAAAAALEERGWRGHFFVTTGRIGTKGFVDAHDLREIAARGHLVGSHSCSHPPNMNRLPRHQIAAEWRQSRAALAEVLGAPPVTAAVPGGSLSQAVIEEAAAAGFRLLMTSEPTVSLSHHGALTVVGRHTIWANTSPGRAAGYARGSVAARGCLWVEWQAKGIPKRMAPGLYLALRRLRARRA